MHKLLLFLLFFVQLSSLAQNAESLKIVWPEEYAWKIASQQENEQLHLVEIIPGSESAETWTIIGTMMSMKGAMDIPVETMMNLLFEQTKTNAGQAKLTYLEKNEQAAHPWILFKIEAADYNDHSGPESQLYYVLQGESALYITIVAQKQKKLKKKFVKKWSGVFKASELVHG